MLPFTYFETSALGRGVARIHFFDNVSKLVVCPEIGKNSYRITPINPLIRKDKLVIDLRATDYIDPRGLIEKLGDDSYVMTMNRRITLSVPADLGYVFGIVEQSYQNVL